MIIDRFLNQQATLQRRIGTDDFAEYTYAAPVQIPVRLEQTDKLVERADGSVFQARNVIFTNVPINVGDKINGNEVLTVVSYVGRMGEQMGWEVTTYAF